MLFLAQIFIHVPPEADQAKIKALSIAETELAKEFQRKGKWRHIWRIAGHWANASIFDVKDAGELHEILTSLPLFPYMKVEITPLCGHPASIAEQP
jgi:muconolactone D-isomerase